MLNTLINNGNSNAGFGKTPEEAQQEMEKNVSKSDLYLFIPAIFNCLQGTELLIKGLVLLEVKVKDEAEIAKLGVQPLPKTEAGERDVVLPESAFKIIKQILAVREDGEYLFMRNGKRMRSNKFRYRLKTTCFIT